MKKINGRDLYHAFSNGAVLINQNIHELNMINFFPVADGDTGTNMATTVNYIVDNVGSKNEFNEVLLQMSEGALIGARGNSGFIIAQFVNGVYQITKSKESVNEEEFICSLKQAVPYVFESISNPVSGTIITLIDAWTDFIYHAYEREQDFEKTLKLGLHYSEKILLKTKEELEVLKKNKVVDAGAKGFYHFIEGLSEYFINNKILSRNSQEALHFEKTHHHARSQKIDSKYRFCTELLFQGSSIDEKKLKEFLNSIGDSSVVVANETQGKIHVHTDTPELLAKKIYEMGYTILENKIDDLKKQLKAIASTKKVALVTDSVADIPSKLIEKYNIYILPMTLVHEKNQFLDRLTMKSQMFYKMVEKSGRLPKTSMPNLRMIKRLFTFLSEYYEEILYIGVASQLSGTYNAVKKIANQVDENIIVMDSKKNSVAQGLVVIEAAKMIDAGVALAKIQSDIQHIIDKTNIYVAVDTLKYMVKNGRVPKALGFLGQLLNLKPIVSLDATGKGVVFGKSFSHKKALDQLFELLKKVSEKNNIKEIAIAYSRHLNRQRN